MVICEFHCTGFAHLPVNSSIIISFLLSGKNVLFIGYEDYWNSIKHRITKSPLFEARYLDKINFFPLEPNCDLKYKYLTIDRACKKYNIFSNASILFLSGDTPDLIKILSLGTLRSRKTFFCLHGILDSFHRYSIPAPKNIAFLAFRWIRVFDSIIRRRSSLIEYKDFNIGISNSFFNFFCNLLITVPSFHFIHFKPSQHINILRYFFLKAFHRKVLTTPLPILINESKYTNKGISAPITSRKKLRIVALGRHSLQRFIKLIRLVRKSSISSEIFDFSFCGSVNQSEHSILKALSIEHYFSAVNNVSPDSYIEYKLASADLGLLLYSSSHCRFGNSLCTYDFERFDTPVVTTSKYLSTETKLRFTYFEKLEDISEFLTSYRLSHFLESSSPESAARDGQMYRSFDLISAIFD